jgi:nucleoside-diphosphate-sugar epimerase
MGERYFITGAQGCIGSWIVKALIERGDGRSFLTGATTRDDWRRS